MSEFQDTPIQSQQASLLSGLGISRRKDILFSIVACVGILLCLTLTVRLVAGHSASFDGYFTFPPSRVLHEYGMIKQPTPIHISSLGFWRADFNATTPEGIFRTICLGQSSTCNYFNRGAYVYPQLQEQIFEEHLAHRTVEVINAGIAHADPDNLAAMFIAELLIYRPELITIYSGVNDAGSAKDASSPHRVFRWMYSQFYTYVAFRSRRKYRTSSVREFLVKLLAVIFKWVKSSPVLSSLYYDVANMQFFSNLQTQEIMLSDNARVDAYYHAILKHVKEGDLVVDLGTGSGILSFFASLKNPRKIYAIEHSSRMIAAAEIAGNHNGIKNIEFVNVNSKDFVVEEKMDIILQEQMGPFLFDENMVENVVDLRDRVLKQGGKILPSKFELFVEPVKIVDGKLVPFIWEKKVHNVSFDCFRNLREEVGGHYGRRFITADAVEYFLCDPERVLGFDLEFMRSEDIARQIQYVRRIVRDGRLDGFCLYFNVVFDEDISFSTCPFGSTTNWGHVLLRVESKEYKKGDSIEFNMVIDNVTDSSTYRWSYK